MKLEQLLCTVDSGLLLLVEEFLHFYFIFLCR